MASSLVLVTLLFSILLHLRPLPDYNEQLLKSFGSGASSDSASQVGNEATTVRGTNARGPSEAGELSAGETSGGKFLVRGGSGGESSGRGGGEIAEEGAGDEPSVLQAPTLKGPSTDSSSAVRRGEATSSSSTGGSINVEEAERCSREVLRVFVYDIPLALSAGFVMPQTWDGDSTWEAALWSNQTVPMLSELTRIPPWKAESLIRIQHSVEHFLTADILAAPGKWLLQFLLTSPWWQRSSGSDHIIPLTHPRALAFARNYLSNAIHIVVDFWRYPVRVSNLTKDIVTPYHHVQPFFWEEDKLLRLPNAGSFARWTSSPNSNAKETDDGGDAAAAAASAAAAAATLESLGSQRDILIYFRGRLRRKDGGSGRKKLQDVLRDESGIVFVDSIASDGAIGNSTAEMQRAKFCLHIVGDTPSSCRFFDAIASGCVPVVISDHLELPFESSIDYSDLAFFVAEKDALQQGYLVNLVRSISEQTWTNMRQKMRAVWHHLEFHQPSTSGDAVDMIWKEVRYRRCKWFGDLFENRKRRLKEAKLL